ncbi:MAG TPA: tryptophanase [Exilispira sp.]|nr:tryptophanase [Exilispira sp.]
MDYFSMAESYKIKVVENLKKTTLEYREKAIKDAGYSLFGLKSEDVFIDLLTDSGTGSMSNNQWAAIMKGDESYAGASSFYELKNTINELLGLPYVIPTHQGRAAENVLFSALLKEGDIVPGNKHFDTTLAHIEFRHSIEASFLTKESQDPESDYPFKGNVDLEKVETFFKTTPREKIPLFILTITCNSSGGQPVSMENIINLSKLCDKYGIMLFFDAARFAENAYFIKTREKGYENKTIKEIVKQMFSYVDGCTMSSKKDGLVNIGGFIALKDKSLYEKLQQFCILFEGFIMYGGMAGRDMSALAVGLNESTEFEYLNDRISQVAYLHKRCKDNGIPLINPAGGHAVFVNASKMLPHIPHDQFPAQALGVELYIEAGVRGVEIGTLLADRDPLTGKNRKPDFELLRLAIPRRVYTNRHMDVVATALGELLKRKDKIRGMKLVYEPKLLRHFTAKLDWI